jgi:hypothetical protein
MKTKIVLSLILLLLVYSISFAQTDYNNGLVLRGRDFGGSTKFEKEYIYITIKLRMELINTGEKSIILINPNLEFGKWQSKVNFSTYNFQGQKVSFSRNTKRTNAEELTELAKSLDVEKPPQNLTVILDAGDSLQFEDKFEVKLTRDEYDSFQRFRRNLTAEYSFSLVKYHPDPDLLEKLQSRWRKYGYLPVDKNGGFSITSELLK